MSSHYRDRRNNDDRSQKRRHPGNLKGKQIGLWYAQRSKEKVEENRKQPVNNLIVSEFVL